MLWLLFPYTQEKRAVRGALATKNSYGINHCKHHDSESYRKKERRSDLIFEISNSIKNNSIKKKYINKSFKFILK